MRSERSQVHHEGKLEGMLEASGAPHGPSDVTRLVSRRASGEVEGANGPRAGHAGRGNEEEKARAPSDIDRLMRISDARSVLESLGVPGDTVKEEDIGGMLVELGARKLEGGELRAALAAFSVAVRAGFADATSMEGLARVW